MNVTILIPDDFAAWFGTEDELGRRAVEALALEEFRAGRLSKPELRQIFGFATRGELDDFLKKHEIFENYALDDLARERETLDQLDM